MYTGHDSLSDSEVWSCVSMVPELKSQWKYKMWVWPYHMLTSGVKLQCPNQYPFPRIRPDHCGATRLKTTNDEFSLVLAVEQKIFFKLLWVLQELLNMIWWNIFPPQKMVWALFSVYFDFTENGAICMHWKHYQTPLWAHLPPQPPLDVSGVFTYPNRASPPTWQSPRCHLVISWWPSPKLMPATGLYRP